MPKIARILRSLVPGHARRENKTLRRKLAERDDALTMVAEALGCDVESLAA